MSSVEGVTQTITSVSNGFLQAAKDVTLSLSEKMSGMSAHLYSVKDAAMERPFVSLTTVALTLAGYYFLVHSRKTPPPSSERLIQITRELGNQRKFIEIPSVVQSFVQKLIQSTDFKQQVGPAGINAHTIQFLVDKITSVADLSVAEPPSKSEMIDRVIYNFTHEIATAQSRTMTDMQAGKLRYLGVGTSDRITEVQPLGDETHNRGKIPFKITFESGVTIVYKPRSMVPEKLICDTNEGLLRHEGFGTYGVVCAEDENRQEYGYSEFIQNIEGENTISSHAQLTEYVRKICVLQHVGKALGLSDLHYQNIITRGLNPHIIDAEVFLNPLHTPTGIFSPSDGPLYVFDASRGTEDKLKGKNKVWFDAAFLSECHGSLPDDFHKSREFGIDEEVLEGLGLHVPKILDSIVLADATVDAIKKAHSELEKHPGRFVLEQTTSLKNMILRVDHKDQRSCNAFQKAIVSWLGEEGFIFNDKALPQVIDGLREDALNQDVPTFEYDKSRDEVLFKGTVIGVKAHRS